MQQLLLILFLLYHTKENKGTTTKNLIPLKRTKLYHTKENKGTTTDSYDQSYGLDYTIPKKIRELQL